MQPTRTNNDINGWHNALNRRASGRSGLAFYVLIELLHQEARLVEVQMRLVADRKLTRIQKKIKYRELQAKLHFPSRREDRGSCWSRSKLYGPTRL